MPARLVREEDPEARVPLRLLAPVEPPEAPPAPPSREAVVVHAVGLLTALAAIVTARLILCLSLFGAIGLTAYAEYVHTVVALIGAALYALLVLLPIVGLALRKG